MKKTHQDNLKHAIETLRNMERRDTPATIILTHKMWNVMKKINKKYVESSPYLKIIKQPMKSLKASKLCDHVFGKIAVSVEGEMHIYNMRVSNMNYRKMAKDPYFENVISLLAHCCDCGERINLAKL